MNKKQYMRKWKKENKEYCNTKAKEFYRDNKEEINIRRRKNPRSLYSIIKRNAHLRNIPLTISVDDFIKWWNKQKQICTYCHIPIERLKITNIKKKLSRRLSIDRINNNKGYEKDNLVLACLQCNFIKSNLFTFDEMKKIGQKYIKPKWQS